MSASTGYLKMAKKSSSGVPYVMPSGKPTYNFVKDAINIKVYYNSKLVEIFQTASGHTQRMTMNHNDYENFENRLKNNGFKVLALV